MSINCVPFLGWLLSFIANASLAVPFWFCWTYLELGRIYFYFVPVVFQSIPFWNCVGLFMILGILRHIFTFKFVEITQNNK